MVTSWIATIFEGAIRPFKWWGLIAPWESGLRVRLGKTSKIINPGLYFRIPFLDRVFIQSTRLKTLCTSGINALTKDGKNVIVSIAISFTIKNIKDVYNNLSSPDNTISAIVSNEVNKYIVASSAVDITFEKLESIVSDKLNGLLSLWGLGNASIKVTSFTIAKVYRLISNEYFSGSLLYNLEDHAYSGEKK